MYSEPYIHFSIGYGQTLVPGSPTLTPELIPGTGTCSGDTAPPHIWARLRPWYVSFGSKVMAIIIGCVAMGSAVLFILGSRLILYSGGSRVNRVQVVLSGFRVKLQVWLYVFIGFTRACVCRCDGMSSA